MPAVIHSQVFIVCEITFAGLTFGRVLSFLQCKFNVYFLTKFINHDQALWISHWYVRQLLKLINMPTNISKKRPKY